MCVFDVQTRHHDECTTAIITDFKQLRKSYEIQADSNVTQEAHYLTNKGFVCLSNKTHYSLHLEDPYLLTGLGQATQGLTGLLSHPNPRPLSRPHSVASMQERTEDDICMAKIRTWNSG